MPGRQTVVTAAQQTWRQLLFFNFYRLVLACLLSALALSKNLPEPIGAYYPDLFLIAAITYGISGLCWYPLIIWRVPSFNTQATAQVFLDILMITLLMHASGGISSGLGMLLIVVIAGGGLLMPGRMAILFAAMGSIALLAEQIRWSIWLPDSIQPIANYTQAGMLGITFFATAALAMGLGNRVRGSAALAAQKTSELADLALLNDEIIKRMQTGLLVVDAENRVALANRSAESFLKVPLKVGQSIDVLAQQLLPALANWRNLGQSGGILATGQGSQTAGLLVRFAYLGQSEAPDTLVLIEDAGVLKQHAQLLNMASLGKLSASIAHEVRNPLGAISHAAQLLNEQQDEPADIRHLTSIILRHSERVNHLVNEILELGKKRDYHPESFLLKPWVDEFVSDFVITKEIAPARVSYEIPGQMQILFDRDQLQQVLWNLCDNALLHSREAGMETDIMISARTDAENSRQLIEVADRGPGVSKNNQGRLFEPFFTTASRGTGLGLYVCRELCVSNGGMLEYQSREGGGALFRLLLPVSVLSQVI